MRLRQQRQLGDFCEDLGPTSSCLIYDAFFPSVLGPIYHFIGNQTSSADRHLITQGQAFGGEGATQGGVQTYVVGTWQFYLRLYLCAHLERGWLLAPLAAQSSWYPEEHQ